MTKVIPIPDHELHHMTRFIQPVLFRTWVAEAPYSMVGTAFLIGRQRRGFAITARHVIGSADLTQIALAPNLAAKRPFRLLRWAAHSDDAQATGPDDFVIMEVDLQGLSRRVMERSYFFNFLRGENNWVPLRHTSSFFTIGCPREANEIDYDAKVIRTHHWSVAVTYLDYSALPNCHEIILEDSAKLPSTAGMSGSPVFCIQRFVGRPSAVLLCGIIISGDRASGRAHFLDIAVIEEALEYVLSHSN